MKNVISQYLGLDLVNINVYAKVYQNIPLSSRDSAIFTFLEFGPRQRLGQSQMTFDNPLGYILSISVRMHNFIKIFQLLVFFCSSVPVVLFDTPGISRCRSQHVSVESSSLLHHKIYLWFICFPWWSIDELEDLHADRTTVCFEPW